MGARICKGFTLEHDIHHYLYTLEANWIQTVVDAQKSLTCHQPPAKIHHCSIQLHQPSTLEGERKGKEWDRKKYSTAAINTDMSEC